MPGTAPTANAASLAKDLLCFQCGYNLKTLTEHQRCPECGSNVINILRHGWLEFANPVWLKKILAGVNSLLAIAVIAIGGFAILAIVAFDGAGPFGVFLAFVLAVAWFVSLVHLTAPDQKSDDRIRPRRTTLAIWILILNGLPVLAMVAVTVVAGGLMFEEPRGIMILLAGHLVCTLAMMIGLVLVMLQLRRLAQRSTRSGLARMMSLMFRATVVITAAGMIWISSLFVLALSNFTGVAATAAVTTSGPAATSGPTTAPGTAAVPTPPPSPVMYLLSMFGIVAIGFAAIALAWLVCGIITLLMFKKELRKAIAHNQAHLLDARYESP